MRKKYQAHLFIQFLCVYPSPRCATISRKIKRQTDKLLFIRTCYAQSIFDLSDLYRCAISRKTTFNYVYTIHLKQISILKACILLLSFPDESIATTKEARQDWTFIQQETQFQDQNPTQNNDDPEKHIPYPPAYGNCTASSHCLGHNVECNLRLSRCVSITTDKSIITNQKKKQTRNFNANKNNICASVRHFAGVPSQLRRQRHRHMQWMPVRRWSLYELLLRKWRRLYQWDLPSLLHRRRTIAMQVSDNLPIYSQMMVS